MKLLPTILLLAVPLAALAGPLGLTRGGYEGPAYKVTKKHTGFEVRQYKGMKVVSTKMNAAAGREEQDSRFMRLFRYIDKGNANDQKIAMTSPVFMESGGTTGAMSFVIPSEVVAKGAPKPKAGNVYLNEIKAGSFAVMRFRGGRSATGEKKAVAALRKGIAAAGLKAAKGSPMFAYYDPPWTPKALRRNEVLIRLR